MGLKSFMGDAGKGRSLGVICLIYTMVILIAGLWPFNFIPANKVEWIKNENGIRFNSPGIVYSREPLSIQEDLSKNAACSIELLLRPHGGKDYMSILAFSDRNQEQFMFGQFKKEFYIRVPLNVGAFDNKKRYREIGINNTLQENTTHLITVTSNKESTAIYVDGHLKKGFPNFSFIPVDHGLSGYLILGNSPEGNETWDGALFGLAIYDRTLNNKEVLDRYHEWHMETKGNDMLREDALHPLSTGKLVSRSNPSRPSPIALYLFDEHSGTTIQDHSGLRNDLLIPTIFHPLRRTILEIPTRGQWFTRSNITDVLVNILGFVPFGFFLIARLRQTDIFSAPLAYGIAILLGFCLSIAIELAQIYIPTRDSSLLDVVSNTLGTMTGVVLFVAARLR